jgi:hypothetical protein
MLSQKGATALNSAKAKQWWGSRAAQRTSWIRTTADQQKQPDLLSGLIPSAFDRHAKKWSII